MPRRTSPYPAALSLLLAGLALAACQTTNKTPVTAAPVEEVAAPAEAPAVEPAPQVTALPAEPEVQEPPINDDPGQLMGLDRSGLIALLGKPDLVRREQPAEIWQYLANDCVFDVVLYDTGRQYRVTYLEARNAAADRLKARPCLNQILRARLDASVS